MSRHNQVRSRPQASTAPAGARRSATGSKAAAGVPRYLELKPKARRPQAEQEADAAARDWHGAGKAPQSPLAGPASPRAAAIAARAGAGRPLDARAQSRAQARYDIDTTAVRVHDDHEAAQLARGFGANALTVGNDIFFGQHRYAPDTPEGERVLAHELAHVAQQGGAPRAVQCDLAMSLPVTLGLFEINMLTQAGGGGGANPGMMGTIAFDPDPHGPYSAEIGLVQAVNVTDVAGATNPSSGAPVDWRNVIDINTGTPGTEAGRMEMMTPGLGGNGAPAGWYIDSLPSATPRGDQIGPNYIEHFGIGGDKQFGWLRSPTDTGRASLFDFPQMSFDADFDFETVAKGTDNQTIYGSLFWGFGIRSGAVDASSEYVFAQDGASATFDEALERFRGYYVHEPVVLYFDTNQEIPVAGEDSKLADIPDYLDRYPDVLVWIEGFADERGRQDDNAELAQRRANAAHTLLLALGVDPARVEFSFGWGETTEFSQHGAPGAADQRRDPGLLQANRRVVISFTHTMSNHPIVMP